MRVAPIIHTRTFSCDFNSEFMVRPEIFMDSDIRWARQNVLGATEEIDGLNGFRWLIADNGKYRMAGVVGFLKSIFSKSAMSDSEKSRSEEMFYDNKGRQVYAFIGVVIDKYGNNDYGKLPLDYLCKIYIDRIYPIWKSSYQETILESFRDEKFDVIKKIPKPEAITVDGRLLFETNPVMDYDLFLQYLCDSDNDRFSFCSNISDFNTAKKSDFSVITTSQNIITRLKRNNAVIMSHNSGNEISQAQQVSHVTLEIPNTSDYIPIHKEKSKQLETKKKLSLALIILLVIFVIIILILLYMMHQKQIDMH